MTNEELDAATKGWRTHPDPQHEETFADTERKLREIITTLRAQLAEARAERDVWEIDAKRNHQAAEIEFARADRAEAALAAQIEVDAGMIDAITAEASKGVLLGGARDRAVLDMMKSLSAAIRNQPHDRTALDQMLAEAKADALQGPWDDKPDDLTDAVHKAHPVFTKKYDTYTRALELVSNRHSKGALVALVNYLLRQSDEAREKALREAADVIAYMPGSRLHKPIMKPWRDAILALIEKPNAR